MLPGIYSGGGGAHSPLLPRANSGVGGPPPGHIQAGAQPVPRHPHQFLSKCPLPLKNIEKGRGKEGEMETKSKKFLKLNLGKHLITLAPILISEYATLCYLNILIYSTSC